MQKRIVSLYLDSDIVARHKKAGSNISQLCNDYLASCFRETAIEAVTAAATKQDQLKQLAVNADEKDQVNALLNEARNCLCLKPGIVNNRSTIIANEKRVGDLLAKAQELSGLSLSELRAKIAE